MFKWLKGVFKEDDENINLEQNAESVEEMDEDFIDKMINNESTDEDFYNDRDEFSKDGSITENTELLDEYEESDEIEVENETDAFESQYVEVPEVNAIEEEIIKDSAEEASEKPASLFQRLFQGLEKTRNNFTDKLNVLLGNYIEIDEDMFEEIEDILITADVGVPTTLELIERLRKNIKENRITDPKLVIDILMDETKGLISESKLSEFNPYISPTIILVVGVNGVGKTTTIGKLASKYKSEGKKVLLAAADTFRAAAIEQLQEWANRSNTELIHQNEGSDPAAVVYDAIQAAKSRKVDILICDTAGRLHNKANLMKELEKIYRIIDTNYPEANKESLIVLDATTGQNAIQQAKTFKEMVNVTGIALTKLDGTAKGGVVLPLISELKLPVTYIGVGERIEDLQEFNSDSFVNSIFGRN